VVARLGLLAIVRQPRGLGRFPHPPLASDVLVRALGGFYRGALSGLWLRVGSTLDRASGAIYIHHGLSGSTPLSPGLPAHVDAVRYGGAKSSRTCRGVGLFPAHDWALPAVGRGDPGRETDRGVRLSAWPSAIVLKGLVASGAARGVRSAIGQWTMCAMITRPVPLWYASRRSAMEQNLRLSSLVRNGTTPKAWTVSRSFRRDCSDHDLVVARSAPRRVGH
jgi:hypothetical protein